VIAMTEKFNIDVAIDELKQRVSELEIKNQVNETFIQIFLQGGYSDEIMRRFEQAIDLAKQVQGSEDFVKEFQERLYRVKNVLHNK
jgi:hypothetical protein